MDIFPARTLFSRTLLLVGVVVTGSAAQAAPIDVGSLFASSHRHIAYGTEVRTPRDEARVSSNGFGGLRSNRLLGARSEVAVPEPGAALLFGLGALVVARSRRRS